MSPTSSWRRPRNPMVLDGLLMLLLSPLTLVATVAELMDLSHWPVVPALAMGVGFTLPLLWRRSHADLAALAVVAVHLVQVVTFNTMTPANLTAPLMVFAAVRHGREGRQRLWLGIALAGALAGALRWGWYTSEFAQASVALQRVTKTGFFFLTNAAVVLAAWFMGLWLRQRQTALESLRQRAEAVEREHDKAVQLAAEEERSRIAREMHDVVAHSLSVIVVQADGAGYLASHDELGDAEARLAQVTRAIQTIRETAGTALGETRRLVGVLRHEGEQAELAPAATLDQIAELVQNLDAAGIPARFQRTGGPGDHAPLSPGAQMALYRVAQESLTNVMKHAGPAAAVLVELDEGPSSVTLVVTDNGLGATPTDGAGHGVVGMRERMTAWGGRLEAGPRADGGYQVWAQLPVSQD